MKTDFGQVGPGNTNNPLPVRQARTRPGAVIGLILLVAILIFVVRPVSHRSPTIDILGSYFPAWMTCIVSGLTLTLIAHWIIQLCDLKSFIGPAPLIYPCLMIIFTFATWILFYQN